MKTISIHKNEKKPEQDYWYRRYTELAGRYIKIKQALEMLYCFKELDSCAIPIDDYNELNDKYAELRKEREKEQELIQAPFEQVIDSICCELLCAKCFAKTLHVAGSDVMMARMLKYYHGKYSDQDAAHKRIQISSERAADGILLLATKKIREATSQSGSEPSGEREDKK